MYYFYYFKTVNEIYLIDKNVKIHKFLYKTKMNSQNKNIESSFLFYVKLMNFYIFIYKINFIHNLKIIEVIHGPFRIKRSTIMIFKRIQIINYQDKI